MANYIGPLINNTKKNFTTRDNLGIEGTSNTMAANLCPIVNTVTPHPYYWAFIAWCYWKFFDINGYYKYDEVKKFIRRINFFITLGNVLDENSSGNGFTGVNSITGRLNSLLDKDTDSFRYYHNYIVELSTMGYYTPGLLTMNLFKYIEDESDGKVRLHIAPKCVRLAKAYDAVISKTEYYKQYLEDEIVPRRVLIELGSTVHIDMDNFDECKQILTEYLFGSDTQSSSKLSKCKDYICYIKEHTGISVSSTEKCRRVFFDEFSVRGNNKPIISELSPVAKGFEIVACRHYFVAGLEVIWQHMLNQLVTPMSISQWISCSVKDNKYSFDITKPLSLVVNRFCYNSSELEDLLAKVKKDNEHVLERALITLVSVYNRLKDRTDFPDEIKTYLLFGGTESVSLKRFLDNVDEHRDASIEEFLRFIMQYWLVNQHFRTAYRKMLDDKNGFYIEEINDNEYIKNDHVFNWGFQANRMVQLYSVMKDLGVI